MKRMKGKIGLVGLAAVVALVSFAGTALAAEPYKIGAAFGLTGPGASIGDPSRKIAEMLLKEINDAGGVNGHIIELVTYDTESDPTRAVSVIQRLISNDNVLAIIGPTTTGEAMASIKFVEEAGVPMVACVGGAPVVVPVKKWVFKTPQTDTLAVERLFDYFAAKGIKKLALLTSSGGFGDSGRKGFMDLSASKGTEIVADERYGDKDTDMTAQLTSIKGKGAQAIVVWGIGPAPAIIAKNVKQLAVGIPLFMSHGVADPNFLTLAGDAAEGVMMPASSFIVADKLPDSDPSKPFLMGVKKRYEEKYGPVSTHTGYAYDALKLVELGLAKAGTDRAGIRDAIENAKGYVGINGVFNMSPQDHNGLTKDSLMMVTVKNGGWAIVP